MYVCICARVRESEVRAVIRNGARCEEAVGAACSAGTACGTCLDRLCDLIDDETGRPRLLIGSQASRDALVAISA
jgi:bacterioferritin-associated ferredoxin